MPVGWDTEMNEHTLFLQSEALDSIVMQHRRFQKMWGMQNETQHLSSSSLLEPSWRATTSKSETEMILLGLRNR